jgi:DNA-binding winged helix-turn-helix (wHTH) protein
VASTSDAHEANAVAWVLRWPSDRERLATARRDGVPRLVLVEPEALPPAGSDILEDWVRLPATDEDIRWRVENLELRAAGHTDGRPILDSEGLLRHDGRISLLSPIEHRLLAVLVDSYRMVVSRHELFCAGWPLEEPNDNALDVHLVRLRRRVAEVGLRLRTVRLRGYLLDSNPAPDAPNSRPPIPPLFRAPDSSGRDHRVP